MTPSWLERLQRHWGWIAVLAVLTLVAAARVRLRDFPLERDEGEYAYAGQLLSQGIPPYRLAYNMKFPGTYAAYAAIMAVFGQSPAGIRLGLTCVTALTALLLYWLGRKLLDETGAVFAACVYGLLAASPALMGLSAHATHFAALFVTAGLCLIWPAGRKADWPRGAAAGFMFGMAVLMKQHAAIFSIWGLLFIAFRPRPLATAEAPRRRVRDAAAYCAGVALPVGLTFLLLWRAGVFERFWFWTITYAREYVAQMPVSAAPVKLENAAARLTLGEGIVWIAGLASLVFICLGKRASNPEAAKPGNPPAGSATPSSVCASDGLRAWLVLLNLCGLLSTVPGYWFRPHYFLLALPPLALAVGAGISASRRLLSEKKETAGFRSWPATGVALALGVAALQNWRLWFVLTPVQVSRAIYPLHPFVEAEAVAEYIRTNAAPEARIAVLGSEPEIYFLSRRHSATGYIYMYPLMEVHPYAERMQREMISEIESAKPEYVVLAAVPFSWGIRRESKKIVADWWEQSGQTNYDLVGATRLEPTDEPHFIWGQVSRNFDLRPDGGVLIYRRRG